jgi:hypothetical protein
MDSSPFVALIIERRAERACGGDEAHWTKLGLFGGRFVQYLKRTYQTQDFS